MKKDVFPGQLPAFPGIHPFVFSVWISESDHLRQSVILIC